MICQYVVNKNHNNVALVTIVHREKVISYHRVEEKNSMFYLRFEVSVVGASAA